MSIQDVDFLMGQGGKAAKFENIGDEIEGTIISAAKQPSVDPNTGEVKRFKNNDPMYVYVISLQTGLRDPDDPADEGVRRVYAKGGSEATEKGSPMLVAIRAAVVASGAKKMEEGATLKVRFTDTKSTGKPAPAKLYKAKYTPPAPPAIDEADLF